MIFLDEYKGFFQKIGIIGIVNIFISLSAIILLPILTKNLSIQNYGIWVQTSITIILLSNIITLGLPDTMVRFLSGENDSEKLQNGIFSIIIVVIIFAMISSVILLILAKPLSVVLFNNDYTVALLLIPIIFLYSLNIILINIFRTLNQIKTYSLFLLVQTYLNLLLILYFVLHGYGIVGALMALLISYLFITISAFILVRSFIKFKKPNLSVVKEYLSFGMPTLPSALSYWIVDSSDRYLIGIFLSIAFVGYYSPGYNLGTLILMLMYPFNVLLLPILSKCYDNNEKDKIKIYMRYTQKYFLLLAIQSAVGLSLLSHTILNLLTTQAIAANGYYITPFVAFSTIIFGLYMNFTQIIYLEKKTHISASIWMLGAIINITLNIIFLPIYGIIGAAVSTLIAFSIILVISTYYSHKYLKFNFEFRYMLKYVIKITLGSAIMSIFIVMIHPITILSTIFSVLVSIVIYLISMFLLKVITNKELNFIKKSVLSP